MFSPQAIGVAIISLSLTMIIATISDMNKEEENPKKEAPVLEAGDTSVKVPETVPAFSRGSYGTNPNLEWVTGRVKIKKEDTGEDVLIMFSVLYLRGERNGVWVDQPVLVTQVGLFSDAEIHETWEQAQRYMDRNLWIQDVPNNWGVIAAYYTAKRLLPANEEELNKSAAALGAADFDPPDERKTDIERFFGEPSP